MDEQFECKNADCVHNPNGRCNLLMEKIEGDCPFYKTDVQEFLENAALIKNPPEWDAFRRHSKTKPVTKSMLFEWLKEFERICPCEDPECKKTVDMFLDQNYISVPDAVRKVAEYLAEHPEGCAWAMSPIETAKMIIGGSYDETDETDDEVSDECISE